MLFTYVECSVVYCIATFDMLMADQNSIIIAFTKCIEMDQHVGETNESK